MLLILGNDVTHGVGD